MKLTSGYYFFQTGGLSPVHNSAGYVLLRFNKNIVKIQCIAEHLPPRCGPSLTLCLWDSLNIERPFTLGKMILRPAGEELRGEMNFTLRTSALSPAGGQTPGAEKYDCFALVDSDGTSVLCTPASKKAPAPEKERLPFDPFNTTNPAYSWDRAEEMAELRKKVTEFKISPLPEIVEETQQALSKYRHVLLGTYKPRTSDKLYFIIGVPGDRPPALPEQIYRWINKCVSLEEYPYFEGYKLYYFDTENGAAVKAVLRT